MQPLHVLARTLRSGRCARGRCARPGLVRPTSLPHTCVMQAGWAAVFGIVGILIGALVTGFFTLTGPLLVERSKARNEVGRGQLDAIQGVRTASILWLDHLEGTIMDLHCGRPVDLAEFRGASRTHLESLSHNKFAHVGFEGTTLLERLREADRCVQREIAELGGQVSEATYMALRAAFDERARFTPIMTGQTREILRRLDRWNG